MSGMALTALAKDELSRLRVARPCCRKAEVSVVLRFAGGLCVVGGRIVVEAELDTDSAARRLGRDIAEVFGHSPDVTMLAPDGRGAGRYLVRVARDGESLARQAGLLDGRDRPVRGLSPRVVSGASCDAEAAWRGAFLARGSLSGPGRSAALEVACPGPEAALALAGAARRIGVRSKVTERHGVQRVVIRQDDAIGAMLARLGAGRTVLAWQERRVGGEARGTARLAVADQHAADLGVPGTGADLAPDLLNA
jgi:DNA-binding protein WhiA